MTAADWMPTLDPSREIKASYMQMERIMGKGNGKIY
jgi:hypothetical protein